MNHIRRLPTKDGPLIDAVVTEMELDYAEYWHKHYQPDIDSSNRADSGWSWPNLYKWFHPLAGALQQQPFSYCIGVEGAAGEFVPVGMLLVVGKYPYLFKHSLQSVFAWYLASIPASLSKARFGSNPPKAIGHALIDVMLTHSMLCGREGRSGLHASPLGGVELFDFYRKKVGMANLRPDRTLPRGRLFTGNDGHYFYSDELIASQILTKQTSYR